MKSPRQNYRLNSIDRLPLATRRALNAAIAEGGKSIDELLGLVREMDGNAISRSAVHRYKRREELAHQSGVATAKGLMRQFLALSDAEQIRFRATLAALSVAP